MVAGTGPGEPGTHDTVAKVMGPRALSKRATTTRAVGLKRPLQTSAPRLSPPTPKGYPPGCCPWHPRTFSYGTQSGAASLQELLVSLNWFCPSAPITTISLSPPKSET